MTRIAVATLTLLLCPALSTAAPPSEPATPAPAPVTGAGPAAPFVAPVVVRVRLIKGSRQGPASLPPSMASLKQQLSKLAYQRWEQLSESDYQMAVKKTQYATMPYGDHVALTVQDTNGRTVTIEVALAQRNTQSRLTIEKGQRILHQVSGEKNGVAYFVTVHAWPDGP
jgi:hypothetical protein